MNPDPTLDAARNCPKNGVHLSRFSATRSLKLLLGLLLSSLFLGLALRGIHWADFSEALAESKYWYLVPAVLVTMLGHLARAYRWGFLLVPVKRVGIRSLWSATAIGFMANNLLPARLGELMRTLAIARSESIKGSSAFATIVFERILDLLVLLLLLAYGLVYVPETRVVPLDPRILIAANLLLLATLVLLAKYRRSLGTWMGSLFRRLPGRIGQRLPGMASGFLDGLAVATHRRAVVPVTSTSILVWGFALLNVYCCACALRIELTLVDSSLLLAVISVGLIIPSAPAYVGTLQYASVVGLALFGVERSEALAFSALYHTVIFLPITLAGLYSAWRAGFHLSALSRQAQRERT